MAENREYLTQMEENGSINISEEVIASIVTDAMKEIEGVGGMGQNVSEQFTGKKSARGVRAELQDGAVVVDIYLMVRYGFAIPEVAQKVQDCVGGAVGGMTGYPVKAVNVHVGGISLN
ncbi:MAG: Asp23/Gls24 family envelope stress response protein [Eubacteriales bacterium]|nr:Asp23/Gls24 family envelope stress response protein [Eubacteriales bacterium]